MAELVTKRVGTKKYRYIVENKRGADGKNKRTYLESLGHIERERDAKDALANYKSKKKRGNTKKINFNAVYLEYKDRFEKEIGRTIKRNTYLNFVSMSRHFKDFFTGKITDIKYRDIEALKDLCLEKGLSNRSVNVVLIELKKVFNYAIRNEIIDYIPPIDRLKESRPAEIERAYADEMRLLLEAACPDVRFFIEFLVYTGLRPYEFHELKKHEITVEDQVVKVPFDSYLKRGGAVPIPTHFVRSLSARLSAIGDNDYVSPFGGVHIRKSQKSLKELTERLGLNITPKTFRKTYTSIMIEGGASGAMVAKLTRNSEVVSSEHYTHLDHKKMVELVDIHMPSFN